MPVIDVHLVPSAAPPPIAPAVCHALLALTGKAVRRWPIRLAQE